MYVSEDGTVTGSINVTELGEVEPKTDEAKAQLDQINAEIASGQPAEADEEAEAGASEESYEESDEDGLEELRAEAESLGVKVDGRWGAERLQQEIDQAKAG